MRRLGFSQSYSYPKNLMIFPPYFIFTILPAVPISLESAGVKTRSYPGFPDFATTFRIFEMRHLKFPLPQLRTGCGAAIAEALPTTRIETSGHVSISQNPLTSPVERTKHLSGYAYLGTCVIITKLIRLRRLLPVVRNRHC